MGKIHYWFTNKITPKWKCFSCAASINIFLARSAIQMPDRLREIRLIVWALLRPRKIKRHTPALIYHFWTMIHMNLWNSISFVVTDKKEWGHLPSSRCCSQLCLWSYPLVWLYTRRGPKLKFQKPSSIKEQQLVRSLLSIDTRCRNSPRLKRWRPSRKY